MKTLIATLAMGLALALGASVSAADQTSYGVDYVSGRPPFKQMSGKLVIGERGITFVETGRSRKRMFTVPFAEVMKATAMIDRNGPDPGASPFGGLLDFESKPQDWVYVHTETPTSADVVRFKVQNDAAQRIVAKIEVALKKAKEAPPTEVR